MPSPQRHIFVDLDGTLIYSDILLESFLRLIGKNFFYLFLIPLWLSKGRANLKHQIASRVDIDAALLPYNKELIDYLQQRKDKGAALTLISASNEKYVQQVSEELAIFDFAYGSTETVNLKGSTKLRKIQDICGGADFEYAGNDRADLKVWGGASGAIVVGGNTALSNQASDLTEVVIEMGQSANPVKAFIKAMRLHQWLKNGLIFLPLVLSHQIADINLFITVAVGFIAFGLCASSVYLLNDLLDLENDRQHPSKNRRPFASGELPLTYGLLGSPILLVCAFLLALQTNLPFTGVLAIYYFSTALYSFKLKAILLVDVLVLAGLFTVRVVAGAAVILVQPTFWLLAFSMFLFLSLAIVKRTTELSKLNEGDEPAKGRGYMASDLSILAAMGIVSGFMSVLVFALYINDEQTRQLYQQPEWLWLICPLLLYIIGRIWIFTHRGKLHDDPVVFAIRDRKSQLVAVICAMLIWIAA